MSESFKTPWQDAALCACVFAVAPYELGGVSVRAGPGPVRDAWLALLTARLGSLAPIKRIPLHISDARLLGGLDLTATLRCGKPVLERGVMVDTHGGVLVIAMAERVGASVAAMISAALDRGQVDLQRDGVSATSCARFGVVALDEGIEQEERPAGALMDRCAFHLDLSEIAVSALSPPEITVERVAAARQSFALVRLPEAMVQALCATAAALGVASFRASLLACQAARAFAALDLRDEVTQIDAEAAARLIFVPRATRVPSGEEAQQDEEHQDQSEAKEEDQPSAEASSGEAEQPRSEAASGQNGEAPAAEPDPPAKSDAQSSASEPQSSSEDMVLAACQASIPADLLARLKLQDGASRGARAGSVGAWQPSAIRGRPAGVRRGELGNNARLHLIETLRAAAPWQTLRRREPTRRHGTRPSRIEVRREDFQIRKFVQRAQTTTIFVVDASGSAALHRLAETKGAVELLLGECYVRRDQVAVLGFRQTFAELLLPPTRSLVRAKRSLAGLPASGGTPLAAALDAVALLVDSVRRRGDTPVVVILSDGRANIARDGSKGRERAHQDAMQAALKLRASGLTSLFIDTSPHPAEIASSIAYQMGARYLALPHADASVLSAAVRAVVN